MTEQTIEHSVRRIEALITALDALPDPAAREPARELLAVVLDLHGLALARIGALVAASEGGVALLERLAADEAASAVLLLHGLHPNPVEARVGHAVNALQPEFEAQGLGLKLIQSSAGLARVRVRWISQTPSSDAAEMLRTKIETAIFDAAPDLEALEIEGLDEAIAALAG